MGGGARAEPLPDEDASAEDDEKDQERNKDRTPAAFPRPSRVELLLREDPDEHHRAEAHRQEPDREDRVDERLGGATIARAPAARRGVAAADERHHAE